MGVCDSTKTRVVPFMEYMNKDIEKLNKVFSSLVSSPKLTGPILEGKYLFGDKEAAINPPISLLKWLVSNPEKLDEQKRKEIMEDTTRESSLLRTKIFNGDKNTIKEALKHIDEKGYVDKAWYIFEGKTHPDIYIETENEIFIGEAKRTENKLTASTKWLSTRDQLIRHIDSVVESSKKIYAFFILETPDIYPLHNYEDIEYYKQSLPHRSEQKIRKIKESYCGFLIWSKIKEQFPDISYRDRING